MVFQSPKLPKAQKQILEVLSDGRLYGYRDIVLATGKYSNLPAELRERHPRGLGSKGLVREWEIDVNGAKVSAFQIVSISCRLLKIPVPDLLGKPDKAQAEFKERYRQWRERYKEEEAGAKKLGLRHNPYLLLKAMAQDPHHEYTFAELARATGIFSGLVQDLRKRHARHGSLAWKGLIRETTIEHMGSDKSTFAFYITKKGLQLLNRETEKDN